jgi:DNA-binding transcriptional MocR family regulator
MHGLDRDGRVVYAGTFSKVLFPSIRLGFMVMPAHALHRFLAARTTLDIVVVETGANELDDFTAGGLLIVTPRLADHPEAVPNGEESSRTVQSPSRSEARARAQSLCKRGPF